MQRCSVCSYGLLRLLKRDELTAYWRRSTSAGSPSAVNFCWATAAGHAKRAPLCRIKVNKRRRAIAGVFAAANGFLSDAGKSLGGLLKNGMEIYATAHVWVTAPFAAAHSA